VEKRPTVFRNIDHNGSWYVPGGQSFVAAFLRDAGADYLWADDRSSGGMPLGVEAVIERARNADFWLNPGICGSRKDIQAMDDRYRLFQALRTGHVYNNNAKVNERGGNDYWETGVANPHLVLQDLIHIFHPSLLPKHQLIWYRKLPEE
jgi:iron complex transport system substrate-binding protein